MRKKVKFDVQHKVKLNHFSITDFLFLISSLFTFFYFQLFTFYAPDTYVFVKYAAHHNLTRDLSIKSIISNNFIFDLLTVIGDKMNLSSGFDFLIFFVCVSAILFIIKYVFLLKLGKKRDVLLVLVGSFFVMDLNMFRYGLSIFILILILLNNKNKLIKLILSFLSHLLPLIVVINRKLFYLPILFVIFFPLSYFLGESRIFDYLIDTEMKFFKSFLFGIPFLFCFYKMKKSQNFNYKLMKLGESFLILGIIFIFLQPVLAARFLETAFYLCLIANVYMPFNKFKRFVLFIFAFFGFVSRFIGGINAGSNSFISEFIL